jgi:hypothetical protein
VLKKRRGARPPHLTKVPAFKEEFGGHDEAILDAGEFIDIGDRQGRNSGSMRVWKRSHSRTGEACQTKGGQQICSAYSHRATLRLCHWGDIATDVSE